MKAGQKAPRKQAGGLRRRAWWVLRKNKVMTIPDILSSISDGTEKQAKNNLRVFLTKLINVGILSRQKIDDGKLTSNGSYQYRVIVDVGAKSPVVRKDGVYDPNSNKLLEFNHE